MLHKTSAAQGTHASNESISVDKIFISAEQIDSIQRADTDISPTRRAPAGNESISHIYKVAYNMGSD